MQKKFGTFGGVFTPSILTILGVMLYLLFGKVVGNAGLTGTIIIIVIAHLISVTTGLSVSSIATDKKVGAGGVYYVLSRSLGLPIGGALGLTLFIATAISIALYMVGFAEVFNSMLDINFVELTKTVGDQEVKFYVVNDPTSLFNGWSDIDLVRLTGTIGLVILTIIALISTSIAIKTQFIILILIVLSLVAIAIGDPTLATVISKEGVNPANKLDYFEAFALFFPAVTGFTAGVAMSGDLKNPKKSIPTGTMIAIVVGLIVYLFVAIFLYFNFTPETLVENGNLLYEITVYGGIFVILGAIGATLSSALGGILGAPRILQAMSVDKITPKLFAKGTGKGNEPRNALLLTVIIAQSGVLIGELEIIAVILTVFYLAAYGFINLSFFLESWASADFNPSFKVSKWFGLIGFIATFTVMSQISILSMILAFVLIGGIFLYLNKKQLSLGTGDIWNSVWSTVVKKGLRRMEAKSDHKRNWKPNILLFSSKDSERVKFIEFSKALSGQTGIITNFDLIENTEATVLFPKHKQSVKDEELEKYGVFGRQIEVQNEFKGIESIASTFGFSGMEPNTVLMPWPGETKDPIWFTNMTKKLFDLYYNVLYLDHDKRWGFRKKEQIDLWWRSVGNDAELMLSLAKFIGGSSDWAKANVRVLLVNATNTENQVIEGRIQKKLDEFRVKATIKIIANKLDQVPIYELMKTQSAEADLILVGIPEITSPPDFIHQTNELVNTIGSTLLIKASTQFEETDLKVESIDFIEHLKPVERIELRELKAFDDIELTKAVMLSDKLWSDIYQTELSKSISKIEAYHHQEIAKIEKRVKAFVTDFKSDEDAKVWDKIDRLLIEANKIIDDDIHFQLPEAYQFFDTAIEKYIEAKQASLQLLPKKIQLTKRKNNKGESVPGSKTIRYQKAVTRLWYAEGKKALEKSLLEFGYQNYILLHQHKNKLHQAIKGLIEALGNDTSLETCLKTYESSLIDSMHKIDLSAKVLTDNFYHSVRLADRELLEKLGGILEKTSYRKELQEELPYLRRKQERAIDKALLNYSGYWQRNMVLFSLNFQADIYLMQYASRAESTLVEVTLKNESDYLNNLIANISACKSDAIKLKGLLETNDKEGLLQFTPSVNQELSFNVDNTVQYVIDKLGDALESIPEAIELMTAQSVNNIRQAQNNTVNTLEVQLDDIADYLTKINFYKPFKDLLTDYINELKKIASDTLNASFKMQEELELMSQTGDSLVLSTRISQIETNCETALTTVDELHQSFLVDLNELHHQLNESLDIYKIVEQYETLHPQAKLESKGHQIKGKLKHYKNRASIATKRLISTVIQKKQTSEKGKHSDKHQHLISPSAMYLNFIDSYRMTWEVQQNLPYYYNQLFNSKYFSDTNTIVGRSQETGAVKLALNRINTGKKGAVLILGEALAGKTFFLNHTLQQHFKNQPVFRLKPAVKQGATHKGIDSVLKNATGIQGNTAAIMQNLGTKSVFVIDDLETWFLNSSKGAKLLNELANVINQYGHIHYFVLACNLKAFTKIAQLTAVNEAVISTILLKPLTRLEMAQVIETRHNLGGMTYSYQKVDEKLLAPGKRLKIMNSLYSNSKGNIGLALKLWLGSIESITENNLIINPIDRPDFPVIPDDNWQSLLAQFQLHKKLSKQDLSAIYGPDNSEWIGKLLPQLVKAGLIEIPEKNHYTMPSDIRYFIENSYAN